jgi:molybdopterin-guanine dinucleotide biosynthesis protein A
MRVTTMIEAASCVGVVLAGGKSARMGMEKARLRIGDETLLARIVRRLRLALPEVYIVGPPHLAELAPDTQVVPDELAGRGPLGGLSTALAHVPSQRIFLIGCDMPFVEPEVVRALTRHAARYAGADAVALRTPRGLEPLHAVYAQTCASAVRERLAAADGRSLTALLARLRVKELPVRVVARYDPSGRSTFNANSPEEWREALAIYAEESSASTAEM